MDGPGGTPGTREYEDEMVLCTTAVVYTDEAGPTALGTMECGPPWAALSGGRNVHAALV